jgi:hypothetical protein
MENANTNTIVSDPLIRVCDFGSVKQRTILVNQSLGCCALGAARQLARFGDRLNSF